MPSFRSVAALRRCIDQLATLGDDKLSDDFEKFTFELQKDPKDVGMEMGATIHTAGELPCKVTLRDV